MSAADTTRRRRTGRRKWSREWAMMLLGLPLIFGALVLSVGVVEYRPSDDDPAARAAAIRTAKALAQANMPEGPARRELHGPGVIRDGPKQDLILPKP